MPHDESFREAEAKIEEAINSGDCDLDLSGMMLKQLPDSIASMTELISLDLSDNDLVMLPNTSAIFVHERLLISPYKSTFPTYLLRAPESAIFLKVASMWLPLSYASISWRVFRYALLWLRKRANPF